MNQAHTYVVKQTLPRGEFIFVVNAVSLSEAIQAVKTQKGRVDWWDNDSELKSQ